MKVFHHDDQDGKSAASIWFMKYPDAEYIEMDYSKPVPFDKIEDNEDVVILDFSFQEPGDWDKLRKITTRITWIDHHETAIKNAPEWLLKDSAGIRDQAFCGAWLTWIFLFPEISVPNSLKMIDAWDRWTHKDRPDILNFMSGLKIIDDTVGSQDWMTILNDNPQKIKEIIANGKIIREYDKKSWADELNEFAYEIEFEDFNNCIVLHKNVGNSKVFESIWGKYQIYILASYNGELWTVHLYSDKVKVNDIAESFGGGGHPSASGFQCKELPWKK